MVHGFAKSIRSLSAFQTEAEALLEALKQLISSPFPSIIIESDCQILVNALQSEDSPPLWEARAALQEAHSLLKSSSRISLAHCTRDSNKAADWVSKAQRLGSLSCIWASRPPSALLNLLCSDFPMYPQSTSL